MERQVDLVISAGIRGNIDRCGKKRGFRHGTLDKVFRLVFGRRLKTAEAPEQRVGPLLGVPIVIINAPWFLQER